MPKTYKQFPLYLDPKTHEQIRKLAYIQRSSMSEVIRNIIKDWTQLSARNNT